MVPKVPQGVDPAEALQNAVDALQFGARGARSVEGARQDALESIAWSLAGILAQMQRREAGAVHTRPVRKPLDRGDFRELRR